MAGNAVRKSERGGLDGKPFSSLLRMCLLTLSVSHPSLQPPVCHDMDVSKCKEASTLQLVVFYSALYIIALGSGGTKPNISFLNRASVGTWSTTTSEWKLCPVTQVEETKQMIKLIPIFIDTILPSAMVSQVNTLFVKQGTSLDRNIGSFTIPPASLAALAALTMLIYYVLYERVFVKIMRKWANNSGGITLLQRMGVGLTIHVVIMIMACLVERYRLGMGKKHGVVESGGVVPLSILVLAPQYILIGLADAILEAAKMEFFYEQAPGNMKRLGTSYNLSYTAIGSFLSTFMLSTISHITKKHGKKGWVLDNINDSHVDYYYAFLAVLNILNLIFFVVVAKLYKYRSSVSHSPQMT